MKKYSKFVILLVFTLSSSLLKAKENTGCAAAEIKKKGEIKYKYLDKKEAYTVLSNEDKFLSNLK